MKKLLFLALLFTRTYSFAQLNQIIAAGQWHSIFICSDSTAMSSGYNGYGQLGDSLNNNCYAGSVFLSGEIIAVAAGAHHTLFLKSDGSVWGAGSNQQGQLGMGTPFPGMYYTPAQILSLTGIVKIACGRNTSLFIKNDGTVWGCGQNFYGELGNGTTNEIDIPYQIQPLSNIIDISIGGDNSHFLKNDGTVYGCGFNWYGEVGDGTDTNRLSPVQLPSLSGIVALSKGSQSSHAFFLKSDGSVWGCGVNSWGQLGDGTTNHALTPVQINYPTNIKDIATGLAHTVFRTGDGRAWSCGHNVYGQLGDATLTDRNIPVMVNNLTNVIYVAAGHYHSLFGKQDGTTYACGLNEYADLSLGYCDTIPHPNVLQTVNVCSITLSQSEIPTPTSQIQITPNPFHSTFTLHCPSLLINTSITIYNSLGEIVQRQSINSPNQQIDLNVAAGVYFIEAGGRVQKLVAY